MTWFCPEDFEPNEKTVEWAKSKGLTDGQLEDQLERMKDHEYQQKRTDWNRCFRRWIRNGLDWGNITPVRGLRKPDEYTEEQRQADAAKAWKELNRLKAIK